MDKLQKLLTANQSKFRGGDFNLVIDERSIDNGEIIINGFDDGDLVMSYSLNDLLFGTPLLSWLEWKPNWNYSRIEIDDYGNYERTDTTVSDYHKINLCLLDSDSDRIKYLEDNVITDD